MTPLESLVRKAKDGDRAALDQLMAQYRPLLRLLAEQGMGRAARAREDASDVVQLTELEAYRSLRAFRGTTSGEFTAWVKQILRNNLANTMRRHRAGKRDVGQEIPSRDDGTSGLSWIHPDARCASPSQRLMTTEAALAVASALTELPEMQRLAVCMRHLEGRRVDEIAEALDASTAAVAGLLRRGLHALRSRLRPRFDWI
jgi:RNA polymerase sigma-70 factor (ECF subfamily)